MNRVTIHTDSTISINSTTTGYCVVQDSAGTVVRAWHNNGLPLPRNLGAVVQMPKKRYTLSTDAGHAEFSKDFLMVWNFAGFVRDIITACADSVDGAATELATIRNGLEDGAALAALGYTDSDQEAIECAHALVVDAIKAGKVTANQL